MKKIAQVRNGTNSIGLVIGRTKKDLEDAFFMNYDNGGEYVEPLTTEFTIMGKETSRTSKAFDKKGHMHHVEFNGICF